jgi:hypothetical protein
MGRNGFLFSLVFEVYIRRRWAKLNLVYPRTVYGAYEAVLLASGRNYTTHHKVGLLAATATKIIPVTMQLRSRAPPSSHVSVYSVT